MTKRFAVTKDLHSPKYRQRVVQVKRDLVCSYCLGEGSITVKTKGKYEEECCPKCFGSGQRR